MMTQTKKSHKSQRFWRGKIIAGLAALAVATPAFTWALSIDEARHLLERTGFGAAPHEIELLLPMDRATAVNHVVAGLVDDGQVSEPPAFLKQAIKQDYLKRLGDYPPKQMLPKGVRFDGMNPLAEEQLLHVGMNEMYQLRAWWLDQMISTRTPQAERLSLFWHNHFAMTFFDVRVAGMMYPYIQSLRHWGGRDFGGLLNAMMHDPAILVFLDNSVNTRNVPNENFGRELLELFTLGEGNYTQQDIKEVARALAGMSVDFGGSWKYLYRADVADTGLKTVLGQTGPWQGADILRILLEHPTTAEFLAGKFYREYVSLEVDPREVARLAGVLRKERFAIQPFMRDLLMSEAFWAQGNRGQLVKSPIELVVGFVRTFGLATPDIQMLDSYGGILNQELLEPPNVSGWKGGTAWLSAAGMSDRANIIQKLWAAHDDAQRLAGAGRNDLLVRLSGEIAAVDASVQYSLWADGKLLQRGALRRPTNAAAEGFRRPKPVWETVVVPRAELPPHVRSIDVRFDQKMPDSAMFVNWVQLDGKRVSPRMAKHVKGLVPICGAPKGMLYCDSALRFNLAAAKVSAATAMLQDRGHSDINNYIEYATVRMPLALSPGGLSAQAAAQPVQDRFAGMRSVARRNRVEVGEPWQAISAVPPLFPAKDAEPGSLQALRALTLDPTYSLR